MIGGQIIGGAVLPFWLNRPPQEALEVAANAAQLGYPEIWIGEMLHFDAFALAGAVARMSERPIITVGPLPIDLRDPVALAMGIGSIAVIGGRPARLAVGPSSPVVVERWHGRRWSGQAERLEEGVRLIRSVLEGQRTDHSGKHFQTKGFRSALGHQTAHITVAALGPRMTAVAARCGDRLVMNLASVEQVAAAARAVAIPIAVWVVAGVEPTDQGWDQVRGQVALYLRAPGYASALTAAGLGDLVEAAAFVRPVSDLAALVTSDHLEAITAIGSKDQVTEKLGRYREAGAEVMVVPITADDPAGQKTLAALGGM